MIRVMKKVPAFLPVMFTTLLMVFAMMPLTAGTVHAEDYNLWVGETRVTDESLNGDGWNYDPDTCTLTLENAGIDNAHRYNAGEDASIYSVGIDLTIEVKGTSNSVGTDEIFCGIYAENGSLTIKGSGTLNVNGINYAIKTGKDFIIPTDTSVKVLSTSREIGQAIFAEKDIIISSGTVNTSTQSGQSIFAKQNVTISGGTVTAASDFCIGLEDLGIIQGDSVNINGGTVDAAVHGDDSVGNGIAILGSSNVNISDGTVVAVAEGKNSCAIRCGESNSTGWACDIRGGMITAAAIGDGAIGIDLENAACSIIHKNAVLTSTGTSAAIRGEIIAGIDGTGWTDVEGTGEGTEIQSSGNMRDLLNYKKVRFPLVKRTVTFKVVNGSWNDETAADKSVTLRGYGSDVLKLSDGDIPAVGGEPEDGYEAGSWDVTPSTETAIEGNTTYKYTYAPKDYTVTVNNGSGSGEYAKDAEVTITAAAPATGMQFKEWTGDVDKVTFTEGGNTTAEAKFNMPAQALTFEATYEAVPPEPIKVSSPTGKTLTYNGKTQTGVAAGTGYTLSGTTSAANAGSYQAKAILKEGYVWNDGTAAAKSISWKINKATAKVTAPAGKTLTYNGKTQTGVAAGSNYTLTGASATNAGSYTAKAALKTNANYTYKWTDGTTAAKTVKWKINKATKKVTAPAGKTLTYNGKTQTGVAAGADYTLSGTVKAAKAGSYTAKATLKTNANYTYKWTDGTAAARTVKWKINKAANTFSIKARTATVKYSAVKKKAQVLGVTSMITFTNSGQGTRTFVKLSGNKKITVAGTTGQVTVQKKLKKGTYQVKVKVRANGNANYNASAWKTVTFTVRVK